MLYLKKIYYKSPFVHWLLKPAVKFNLHYKQRKQNKLFLKYSSELLVNFKEALDSINIRFWLEFGTLLGAIREKDFIKHDLDLDVGMLYSEYTPKVDLALQKVGFKKIKSYSVSKGEVALENVYEYKGIHIDIFFFRKKGNKFICHGFTKDTSISWEETLLKYNGLLTLEYSFPPFTLEQYIFKGGVFNIPSDVESHLEAYYGPHYMIPDSAWNPLQDSPNLKLLPSNIIGHVTKYS